MKSKCMLRKYVAILALCLSAVLFLPAVAFAQGAVIGYAMGNLNNLNGVPTDEQLNRLTHVIAVAIGCTTTGTLKTTGSDLPNSWNGNKNNWLTSLVSRAHAKGIKVSICISGKTEFNTATNTTNINAFVNEIASFVNVHGLDGVDINWEHPSGTSQWNQRIALLQKLKTTPVVQPNM